MTFTKRSVERKLTRTTDRLRLLREELAVLDEQVRHLGDDADDLGLRAAVSDDLSVAPEARRARDHADTLARQRQRVRARITELEGAQDRLLDRWSAS